MPIPSVRGCPSPQIPSRGLAALLPEAADVAIFAALTIQAPQRRPLDQPLGRRGGEPAEGVLRRGLVRPGLRAPLLPARRRRRRGGPRRVRRREPRPLPRNGRMRMRAGLAGHRLRRGDAVSAQTGRVPRQRRVRPHDLRATLQAGMVRHDGLLHRHVPAGHVRRSMGRVPALVAPRLATTGSCGCI